MQPNMVGYLSQRVSVGSTRVLKWSVKWTVQFSLYCSSRAEVWVAADVTEQEEKLGMFVVRQEKEEKKGEM